MERSSALRDGLKFKKRNSQISEPIGQDWSRAPIFLLFFEQLSRMIAVVG